MIMDAGYFRKLLQNFLNTNEPDLSNDTRLIEERTIVAFDMYRKFENQDKTAAINLAKMKLFEGLEFSVYYLVLELVCKYFNQIPNKSRQEICQAVLPDCIEIYNCFSFKEDIDKSYYKMISCMERIIEEYCKELKF